MNPTDTATGTPQQQVIERLRTAVNVLVTVNNNPTVDQLAAAIGFTLLLNKMGKHATAVFSGDVPSTLEFLKPETTIEKNTDSLRDFIVSLDKSKADKLRYKVEENVVKIFITPYRTSLSEKDLNFSQGDFNVDVVVGLGVSEREQLDQAIIAHGRILHDATVITVSAGANISSLGAVNWQDMSASSLCEMLVDVGNALQPGLLDNQIATAFLTGIVAQTERFRNDKTTPKIMTLSAQLMAAGANQQLIATSLEHEVKLQSQAPAAGTATEETQNAKADGALTIDHPDAMADQIPVESPAESAAPEKPSEIAIDEHGNFQTPTGSDAPADQAGQAAAPQDTTPRHKIIEPLTNNEVPEQTREEKFAGGPHPFTADMTDDGFDEPHTDPLTTPEPVESPSASQPEQTQPDETDVLPPVAAEQPTGIPAAEPASEAILPPAPDTTDTNVEITTLPPAMDGDTLHTIEKNLDSPHITKDPTSTLDEIEEVLDSPHITAQNQGIDSARDAVQDAISATPYNPARPEPMQALNANPLSVGLNQAPASDPVLANLGLTDNPASAQSSPSVLPPAPGLGMAPPAQAVNPPAVPPQDPASDPSAPPVPPPIMPLS